MALYESPCTSEILYYHAKSVPGLYCFSISKNNQTQESLANIIFFLIVPPHIVMIHEQWDSLPVQIVVDHKLKL